MIKYTASGIISRAEQIADLENSDFISEQEKLSLLNESFQILYQKVINTNDRFFLKEIDVEDGMELPPDFYQLSCLCIKETRTPITKRNNVQRVGYDIKGNNIYLSPEYISAHVVMEYIPTPPTIGIKEKTKDSPFEPSTIAINRKIYCVVNDDEMIDVKYIGSDNVIETQIEYVPSVEYALFENGILYTVNDELTFYDFRTSENITLEDVPVVISDTVYLFNGGYIKDVYGNTTGIVLNIELDENTKIIYSDLELTYQLQDESYIINDLDPIGCSELRLKAFMNGELYTMNKAKMIVKLSIEEEVVYSTIDNVLTIVSDKYALTHNMFSDESHLEGLMDDTLFDYQNNLFYTLLAYQLAISFKIKQSADTSQLAALYEQAEEQFYDSLSRDNNAVYQINDVYRPAITSLFF